MGVIKPLFSPNGICFKSRLKPTYKNALLSPTEIQKNENFWHTLCWSLLPFKKFCVMLCAPLLPFNNSVVLQHVVGKSRGDLFIFKMQTCGLYF